MMYLRYEKDNLFKGIIFSKSLPKYNMIAKNIKISYVNDVDTVLYNETIPEIMKTQDSICVYSSRTYYNYMNENIIQRETSIKEQKEPLS